MQLTKHTDFALRSLMYLAALPEKRLANITEIAEQFNIPRNHLMKVVHQLSKRGYIKTLRGPKGGMHLNKKASDINLADLVRDFEVILDPINCDTPPCPMQGGCTLKQIMLNAQQAFLDVLANYTMEDLAKKPDELINIIRVD